METNDKEIDVDDFMMYMRIRTEMEKAVPAGATLSHVMRAAMALIAKCIAQTNMSEEEEEAALKDITENIRRLTAFHKEQLATEPASNA